MLQVDLQLESLPVSGSLELQGPAGKHKTLSTAEGQIEGNFNKAKVTSSSPKSLWIIYEGRHWNSHDPDSARVLRPGSGLVSYQRRIASARGYDILNPGVVLFEHVGFRGKARVIQPSNPNLDVGLGGTFDVHSAIVTGGVWSFYSEYNYRGNKLRCKKKEEFGPGEYSFRQKFGESTTIRSIKFIRLS